jgi:tRNA G18 (ribose-2'-O)-methylase SpoU
MNSHEADAHLHLEDENLWTHVPVGKGQILKYNVHTCFQDMPNEKVKAIAKNLQIPLGIMLLNLDGNMNIAMSIRTATALGCSDVYIVGKRQYDSRGTVGAKNYIRIHRLAAIDPITFFQESKLLPILVEQGGTPLDEFSFKPYFMEADEQDGTPIIVMGSEGHGIPQEWLDLELGPRISITQMGILRSLNVSIASSIVLYEYTKQWRKYVADKTL